MTGPLQSAAKNEHGRSGIGTAPLPRPLVAAALLTISDRPWRTISNMVGPDGLTEDRNFNGLTSRLAHRISRMFPIFTENNETVVGSRSA